MKDWGRCFGYISEPCPECGRVRVEAYENGEHVCEKCGWCPEEHAYIDREGMYDDGKF